MDTTPTEEFRVDFTESAGSEDQAGGPGLLRAPLSPGRRQGAREGLRVLQAGRVLGGGG